ncbi:phasin family protein [Accumulibacter sp.]|uniref:phasin family protein n=1 Tax=Accumulibacter sp. TaxID=2053492 RepID=UPI0025EEAF86|nr:phasin family protein [Accumulibacter sp.]MCM8594624.1 phasin family protein [Accumulibacter sp.]MCM8627261.1 phasin family protein [Accumulibacter sp.]MDS4048770.1 phasin family protein [Accumulibacter sp.]
MTDIGKVLTDWAKAMASLDVTRGSEELLNIIAGLKVPGVNMDALVASQRDNIEALTAANRAAVEGFQAVGQWQGRILHETVEQLKAAVETLAARGSAGDIAASEAELARKALATAVQEMRELAEIVTRANQQASEAILKRVPASLDEIRTILKT